MAENEGCITHSLRTCYLGTVPVRQQICCRSFYKLCTSLCRLLNHYAVS